MLISLFLTPILLFVNFLITLIPAFFLPDGLVTSVASVFQMIFSVSYFLPLSQIAIALTFLIAFHFSHFILAGTGWLLRKIPGLG